jgi:apolipoprotein N-acyltransferase
MMMQCWVWFESNKFDENYYRFCNIKEKVDEPNTAESTPLRNATSDASNVDRHLNEINIEVNSAQDSKSHDMCQKADQYQRSIIHRPNLSPLVFPILLTSLYQMVFRYSPIGAAGNPAMGLAQVHGLRQVTSLLGEIYLVFWIGWIASILVGLGFVNSPWSRPQQNTSETRNGIPGRHLTAFLCVSLFMFIFGSMRELSGRGFYSVDISKWPSTEANEAPLKVSCLTRAESEDDQTALQKMVARTNERLSLGDDLVVWSESAVDESVDPLMFTWNPDNPWAVVAPTFYESTQNKDGKVYNRVQMMQGGSVIASYDKNRPVPIIESGVAAGSQATDPIDVTFTPQHLSTALAICFDLDFPYLLKRAHNADLVVGPSWYWASLGYNLWEHNTFRAIENGFTLIKCSENGITGSVDPFGRTIAALPTLNDDVRTFEVPVQKGVSTVFGCGGWLFGWVCVGLSLLVLISVLSSWIC